MDYMDTVLFRYFFNRSIQNSLIIFFLIVSLFSCFDLP